MAREQNSPNTYQDHHQSPDGSAISRPDRFRDKTNWKEALRFAALDKYPLRTKTIGIWLTLTCDSLLSQNFSLFGAKMEAHRASHWAISVIRAGVRRGCVQMKTICRVLQP
uniref:Uncharacterized protein n=1 Tax=Rhizobium rhizogenes TaxID=359 RepID=A0A7S4ZVK6_RHIRH|nr:hypothetical protein pC6.5d_683 [Rhizobium rhizogenes]